MSKQRTLESILKYAVKRFHTYYEVNQETGCWEWKRSLFGAGYSQFCIAHEGKMLYSNGHRFAYEIIGGNKLADGMDCVHSCDNKKCVNPEHLFEATRLENMLDLKKKRVAGLAAWPSSKNYDGFIKAGEMPSLRLKMRRPERRKRCREGQLNRNNSSYPRGEAHHWSKTSIEDRQDILNLRAQGHFLKTIAKMKGLTESGVSRIISRAMPPSSKKPLRKLKRISGWIEKTNT